MTADRLTDGAGALVILALSTALWAAIFGLVMLVMLVMP
jgi:hypothetical protein